MLKIPLAGDRTPPLVRPGRMALTEESSQQATAAPHRKRSHTQKSLHSRKLLWDTWSKYTSRFKRSDNRQMFWMMIGGVFLWIVIVLGVRVIMSSEVPVAGNEVAFVPSPRAPEALSPELALAAEAMRKDERFLAEAEPMARKFLEAKRIEDLLPLVRNPGMAEARMRRHYPGGIIEAPGMAAFNTQSNLARLGSIVALMVRTLKQDEASLVYEETAQGIKIDWECWVGWSEMPWEVFVAEKPTVAQVFRLMLCPIEYYNMAFANDIKWQSYQLLSPDGKQVIYGYAERGSALNAKLCPPPDVPKIPLMLSLKFPENATSANQVLIENCVADGWVLESSGGL